MPVRSARVLIHNKSTYLTLRKKIDHLCHGDWTPGGWEPPSEIAPGATGGMQSESGGFMTGTEGYVKYIVDGPDGPHGHIYIYWDNPFEGVTHHGARAVGTDDISPDCDVDQPGDSSTFATDTNLDFRLVPTAYQHSGAGTDITSPWLIAEGFAYVYTDVVTGGGIVGVATGIAQILGWVAIVTDPLWEFELRDFTPLRTMTSGFSTGRMPIQLDVFWRGADGAIASTWWHGAPGQSWGDHQPFPITPAQAAHPSSAVATVARTPDHLDVFWVAPDGAIASTWWHAAPGANWGDHQPFPVTPPGAARAGSPVAAVARTPDHLDVFWVAPDGAIASTWWHSGPGLSWGDHQPFPITRPGVAREGSPLAAVARTPQHLDVFFVWPDGSIGSQWWDGAPGQSWGDHQPFPITRPGVARGDSPLAAVGRTPQHLDVFFVWPDGAIGNQWWHEGPGSSWGDHQPFPITGPGAAREGSPLAALGRTPVNLDVFWVWPDGAIGSTWWHDAPGQSWGDHPPYPITAPGAAGAGSPLMAVARVSNHLDVFWVWPDGAIGSTWWDDAPGASWGDHPPYPITPSGAVHLA